MVASGVAFAVQIWCIDRGGPVFVAVYQPVQTLVVAIMASLALGEEFYLGGWVPSSSNFIFLFLFHIYFLLFCQGILSIMHYKNEVPSPRITYFKKIYIEREKERESLKIQFLDTKLWLVNNKIAIIKSQWRMVFDILPFNQKLLTYILFLKDIWLHILASLTNGNHQIIFCCVW